MNKSLFIAIFLLIGWDTSAEAQHSATQSTNQPAALQLVFRQDNIVGKENDTCKYHEIHVLIDEICQKLNGVVLLSINDSIIIYQATGYLKLYDHSKSYRKYSITLCDKMRNEIKNEMDLHTFFEIASFSKQFTSTAILKLISEGKLSINDTLRKFFPKLPYLNITVHHLLSHTSGLPEYFDFPVSWFDTTRLLTNSNLIQILSKMTPKRLFASGTQYKYTNTNYALLAAIVAQVSEMKFEDYVRQNLFAPAGMEQTFFITEKAHQQGKSIASGHLKNSYEQPQFFMDGTVGDKGIYSNAAELYKWKKALFDDYKILPKEWVDLASQPENYTSLITPKELYGYGLRIEENPDYGKLIYHGGLWRGYHHIWMYRPADNLYFVFLSNFLNGAHKGQSYEILRILDTMQPTFK